MGMGATEWDIIRFQRRPIALCDWGGATWGHVLVEIGAFARSLDFPNFSVLGLRPRGFGFRPRTDRKVRVREVSDPGPTEKYGNRRLGPDRAAGPVLGRS